MAKQQPPFNNIGSRTSAPREGYIGAPPNQPSPGGNPPSGMGGFLDPIAPYKTSASQGDTIYVPIGSLFDPRTLDATNNTGAFANRFAHLAISTITPVSPVIECLDILRNRYQLARPGKNVPSVARLFEMLETIIDISRMLTIFYSLGSSVNLNDVAMRGRSRVIQGGREYFPDMAGLLSRLPCPKNIVTLTERFIKLIDVSNTNEFQYIGFAAIGGYPQFEALYNNVRTRTEALSDLFVMYPQIGVLNNERMPAWDADLYQLFSNITGGVTSVDDYRTYVIESGSTQLPIQLQSSGILTSTVLAPSLTPSNIATTGCLTNTAFAVAGSPTYQYIRTPIGAYCIWDATRNLDVAIRYAGGSTFDATALRHENIALPNITANLAHELNLNAFDNGVSSSVMVANNNGTVAHVPLANENTWARVTGDSTLSRMSYNYMRNIIEGLHMMLS